jgi:hypothetical protein
MDLPSDPVDFLIGGVDDADGAVRETEHSGADDCGEDRGHDPRRRVAGLALRGVRRGRKLLRSWRGIALLRSQ